MGRRYIGQMLQHGEVLDLLDWKRRVAELYRAVRNSAPGRVSWKKFRDRRDEMFRTHTQSPLDEQQKRRFRSLDYFPYDPAGSLRGRVMPLDKAVNPQPRSLALPEGAVSLLPFATVQFNPPVREKGPAVLTLFWISGYGGGLLLPFKDRTAGDDSYGGGRYLFDTIKGADLGGAEDDLPLDFNFAYNPSCAYSPRWTCPLAPAENSLSFPIRAGERMFR